MSSTDTEIDTTDTFDLATFIKQFSELFVVMGVFGALAIYISQSTTSAPGTEAELMIKTGFVAAFALSMLMYVLIYMKLIEEFGDWNELYRAHFRLRNIPLAAFSLFSGLFVLSVSFAITQNEPVVFLIVITGTFIVGVGVVTRILYGIARIVPRTPVWRISTMLCVSVGLFLISLWVRTNLLNEVDPMTIQELSLGDPIGIVVSVSTVLVATIQSFAAIGVIGAIIGIPLVMFDKFRGKSPYDEPK